jgi:hypothetical protein
MKDPWTPVPEVHPVEHNPPITPEERCSRLELLVATLWDEVWWHQLPWYRRLFYWAQGFRSPITRFYIPKGEPRWP